MKDSNKGCGFLTGNRIYLREVRLSDVNETYYKWMNDPEITQYLESRFYPNSIEMLNGYVRDKLEDRNSVFMAIVLRENHRHIGNIKIGPIDWINSLADIGILIGEKDCWKKGFAAEAIGLISHYAFNVLNLHKVTAGCGEPNIGSIKAFTKNNFEIEGVRKQHAFCNGKYVDVINLGLVRSKG